MMGSRGWMRFSRGCGRTAIGWQRHLPPAASSGPGVPNQGRDGTAFLDDDTAPPTAIFDDALPWRIQVGAVGLCGDGDKLGGLRLAPCRVGLVDVGNARKPGDRDVADVGDREVGVRGLFEDDCEQKSALVCEHDRRLLQAPLTHAPKTMLRRSKFLHQWPGAARPSNQPASRPSPRTLPTRPPLPRGECRRAANVGLADRGQLGRRCSVADNAALQPMLQPPEIHLSRRHSRADS